MGNDLPPPPPPTRVCQGRASCWAFLALGWFCVALGLVGVVVPGLPTTVFLIVAVWAFSRSSERFQMWLWHHPRLGPPIRDWHSHKVISPKAKALAVTMMSASFAWVLVIAESWVLPAVLAAIMIPAATYVLTRASRPPVAEPVADKATA
ncbi:MAG: YbaN family protein [Rhodobacterales bacterium]|nr:YbaN family protein [Rhodobacterales bacterium]